MFENIVLKSLFCNPEYFGKVFSILKPEYFQDLGSQKTFSLIKDYYGQYREIPQITSLVAMIKDVSNAEIRKAIVERLKEVNSTEEVKNLEFLKVETVKWIKEVLYYKALEVGAEGLQNKSEDLKMKAKQIMEEMTKVTLDENIGLDFDDIDAMIEYYSARQLGIKTQHKELNKYLGPGFLPGTLSVVLAAQGVGKSLFMTDLISGMVQQGKNILLVSLEMSDKEIVKRVQANVLDIDVNSFLDLSKTEGELQQLTRNPTTVETIRNAYQKYRMSGTCGKFFVKDYPAGSFGASQLQDLIERYQVEKGIKLDIVFVDYLGIMKSDLVPASAGLYNYLKSIGEEVRAVAKKMEIAIISASQLNRSVYKQDVKEVDNSAISDSLGTAMTADFMLFLIQNEEMKANNEVVAKVTKNRFNGKTSTFMMNIDYSRMKFMDAILPEDAGSITNPIQTVITPQKLQNAEKVATQAIKEDNAVNWDNLKTKENEMKETDKSDPFNSGLDDIMKELGL
jgi:replicative DNA helicase